MLLEARLSALKRDARARRLDMGEAKPLTSGDSQIFLLWNSDLIAVADLIGGGAIAVVQR